MTKLAPACTAFWSTSSVAIEVVTTPVTTVEGSPILNVSTSSLLQSTPMFFLMRSTISCAVTRRSAKLVRTYEGAGHAHRRRPARRSRVVKWMSSHTLHDGNLSDRSSKLCRRCSLSGCDRAHGRLAAPGGLRPHDETTTTTRPLRSLRRILSVSSISRAADLSGGQTLERPRRDYRGRLLVSKRRARRLVVSSFAGRRPAARRRRRGSDRSVTAKDGRTREVTRRSRPECSHRANTATCSRP